MSVTGQQPVEHGHQLPSKGTTVFVFMILISLVAAGSVIGTVVAVNKDGYGRVPERKFVRSF